MSEVKTKHVEFAEFTADEDAAADRIVDRMAVLLWRHGRVLDRTSTLMDLAAVHYHTPLDLIALAGADDFDLVHDVGGIARHLNRRTGKLEDCFLPRYARKDRGE